MSYTALYRKFRPDNFDDVKGQDHIVTTLTNQIKHNRIGHAYLFCGTRGTGKTTVAKILAKAVNCQHPVNGSPCGECEMCRAIQAGTSMNVIEIDAASNNGVDNIREIREEVAYRPTEGNYKVYIIDEVHMLSTGAFNALLKTLEEPPSYVIFILATTEAHKIPITILSRCQRYDFHRISIDTIAARLDELLRIEGVEAEEKAVRYVAKAGDGSMRDALSLLDQCIAFYLGQTLTYDKVLEVLGAVDTEVFSKLLRKVLQGNVTGAIRTLEDLIIGGRELGQFVGDFTWYMRNLLLVKTSENPEDAIDVSSENLKLLQEESEMVDVETLMRYIRIFSELSSQIRYSTQKRVLVEIALIKLCRPAMETNLDSVLDRLRVLEQRMDERPVQQVIVQQGASDITEGMVAGAGSSPEAAVKPEKAAPEDLQKIVASWRVIVGQTSGIFKQMLQKAIPKYNGQTGEPILYIEFQDFLGKTYVDNPEAEEELKQIITAQTGKSVELKMVVAKEHNHTNLAKVTVDQALRENIHMDVIVEEDPEDTEE
nr:DNA polymerase III subunit gamma/tau [uncultured Blautia sp.]